MINLFQPSAGDAEVAAIDAVFATGWLGLGPRVAEFERAFADYLHTGGGEMLAISSCTEGLFQAVAALGIGPGDEVVLPTISFVGAAHAVREAGARVVLCDVDPVTLNPTVDHVAEAVTASTRAVLILHYGGNPGEASAIAELARHRSLHVIEDAACGLGSFVGGRACGTFGDIGVWSFDSMKVMTTGDGGMAWCRSPETAERIRRGVRLGVASSGFARRGASGRWWEIDPDGTGRRGTMNDIAAAIGLVQLERLPSFLARRRHLAAAYDASLADLAWLKRTAHTSGEAAQAFYWIQTAPALRDRLAAHLLERGVYTNFRYWPLHRTTMYSTTGAFPGADRAAASTLLLPLHQGLSDADAEHILAAVREFDA